MAFHLRKNLFLTVLSIVHILCSKDHDSFHQKSPRVVISVLIRNKQHVLPHFFTSLNRLNYPKNRIILWMYSDHNSDRTPQILEQWRANYSKDYQWVNMTIDDTEPFYADEINGSTWTPIRHHHVIKLRQEALDYAREIGADYVFMLDADVVLTNPKTLRDMIAADKLVAAPMLRSSETYSNFWDKCCIIRNLSNNATDARHRVQADWPGMTRKYTYQLTNTYPYIVKRNAVDLLGCHAVPLVHSAVLIDLRKNDSNFLTYDPKQAKDYDGQADDTVIFAVNARNHGLELHVCNTNFYGFITTPVPGISNITREAERVTDIKLEALSRGFSLDVEPMLAKFTTDYPTPSKLGMDEIFMINLKRRPEKKKLMMESFRELGMDVEVFPAVDGKELTPEYLKERNISMMPGYHNIVCDRKMNAGEIGSFLSQYTLWEEIVSKKYNMTMILEDDIHFTAFFVSKLETLLKEAIEYKFELLYLGRKIFVMDGETRISDHMVRPLYSHWTPGYIMTYEGARKLINADPCEIMRRNLFPVDEFIHIMFHPMYELKNAFPVRDLRAVSAEPPLLRPAQYTGVDGYVSDTEDSEIIDMKSPINNNYYIQYSM